MRKMVMLASALAVSAAGFGHAAERRNGDGTPPVATPVGITLKTVRIGQGVNVRGQSSNQPRARLVLADIDGRTLYVSSADMPGKSNCTDGCETTWLPARVDSAAQLSGDWTAVSRRDGSKQYAFQGHALYTYAKEDQEGADPYMMGGGPKGQGIDGHSVFEVEPRAWMSLPIGLSVDEVLTVPGQVLTNDRGLSIYAFEGDAKARPALLKAWTPVAAPQLALPVGDFTVLTQSDGVYQWAYKGKALYTYKGDVEIGDSNGKDVDPHVQVVTISRYFLPDQVKIIKDQRHGGLLVSAKDGHTLYAHDRISFPGTGGHATRGGARGVPDFGKKIGAVSCDAACEKVWIPLMAPETAKPQGYWTVFPRPDGTKQWGYQGYALYTYAAEGPGDVTGNDSFNITMNHDLKKAPVANLGLYWRIAAP